MNWELKQAAKNQFSVIANLNKLRAYALTVFFDDDICDSGFYGFDELPLYWEDPDRFPFLIYAEGNIAGFYF